jgi:hypothetical protein
MRAGFQNAVTVGVPLVVYTPSHPGADAIRLVARELMATHAAPALRKAA